VSDLSAFAEPSELARGESDLSNWILAGVTLFSFFGFYIVLALAIATVGTSGTEMYTVGIRVLAGGLMAAAVVVGGYRLRSSNRLFTILVLVFWTLYFVRVLYEWSIGTPGLHRAPRDFMAMGTLFGMLPFIYFVQERSQEQVNRMLVLLFLSSIALSVICTYLYWDAMSAGVGRINRARYVVSREYQALSPLALSYTSASAIALAAVCLVFQRGYRDRVRPLLCWIAMGAAVIPFMMGASRGSVVALALPLVAVVAVRGRAVHMVRFLALMAIVLPGLFYAMERSGSNLWRRIMVTVGRYQAGTAVDLRQSYYSTTLDQIATSPFLGAGLQNDTFRHYPHNILLEAWLAAGVIGGGAVLVLVVGAMLRSARIVREQPHNTWIVALFWVAFLQHMFSGAIYAALWFWATLGLLFSLRPSSRARGAEGQQVRELAR